MRFKAIPSLCDINVTRVRLDTGGYDTAGAYWGIGAPLWYCRATLLNGPNGLVDISDHMRAPNARAALHKFLPVYAQWDAENGN